MRSRWDNRVKARRGGQDPVFQPQQLRPVANPDVARRFLVPGTLREQHGATPDNRWGAGDNRKLLSGILDKKATRKFEKTAGWNHKEQKDTKAFEGRCRVKTGPNYRLFLAGTVSPAFCGPHGAAR